MIEPNSHDADLLDAAVQTIVAVCPRSPRAAIILGSGLGGLARCIDVEAVIPYAKLPGFATTSAGGHRGELLLGRLESVEIVAMSGRFHRYEGWSLEQIRFPIDVMHALGARDLIVSNAAGGINPKLRVGDVVVIRDHINWLGQPVRQPVDFAGNVAAYESIRRRSEIYDRGLSQLALQLAIRHDFSAYPGTYLGTLGPNYETRGEYRMMRRIGADVVGMSTIPEVLAAADLQMRVLGLSMVSNVANPDRPAKASHEEVLAAGRQAETKMEQIVRGVLRQRNASDPLFPSDDGSRV